ncbi:hypothetical protein [Actinacidiphila oryziradicis]|nr:hypothetical protein [Actinacidiphila oryziradicis]
MNPQDREPIAEAAAALLTSSPDFHAPRFLHHALSTDPHNSTYTIEVSPL